MAVTISGFNFSAGATVTPSTPDITVSNVNVTSATQIMATFTIAAAAAAGAASVTVSGTAGTSNSATFTINGPPQPFAAIRVNAGGPAYTDSLGRVWSADSNFSSGGSVFTPNPVTGTPDPTLYQTAHFGSTPPLTYTFSVPNGGYTVSLKFDENGFTSAGQRVFDIIINGQTVHSGFDIFAQAGAQFQAADIAFPVTVTNGQIVIQFLALVFNPRVSGIEILPGSPPSPSITSVNPGSASGGNQCSRHDYRRRPEP